MLVKAPAKINLTIDVLYKRPDNYHEVEMVMTTVDLADRIELEPRDDGKIVVHSSSGFVPEDERNLAYQAALLLKNTYNVREGATITIHKEIPVAAGLAGGSSDAAAALRGLNQLWKINASIDSLAELGANIGSDVPFCVYGGTALATGRGEQIKPLPAPPNCWVILAKPRIGVSTAKIYEGLDLEKIQHPNTKQMIQALENKDYSLMCGSLGNVLESVTFSLYPEVQFIKEQMIRFGADAALMSGSGPTVYGLVDHESKLNRVYNGLKGFCHEVYTVRMLGKGNSLA